MLRAAIHRSGLAFLYCTLAGLVIGCAEIEPPSGGPIDKSGPKGLGATPPDGTLHYSGNQIFAFQFDEHIDERSITSSVIVTPRPKNPPEVSTHGKQVVVRLLDSLSANTTYLIALAPTLKDLRGNQLSEQVAIRFSTGGTIDTGRVFGRVLQEGKGAAGVTVVAYAYEQGHVTRDTLSAVYRSVTSNDGQFHLDVLPAGEYLVVAFVDSDRDQRPDLATEVIAIADRVVVIAAEQPDPIVELWLPAKSVATSASARQICTGQLRLLGVHTSLDSQRVSLTMTSGQQLAIVQIVKDDRQPGVSLIEYVQRDTGNAFLEIGQGDSSISIPIHISLLPDTHPPEYWPSRIAHAWGTHAPDSVALYFSEQMDTTSTVEFTGTGRDSARFLHFNWLSRSQASAHVTDSIWTPRWRMVQPFARDLSGNVASDTILTVPYRIVPEDSLGQVSGNISNLPSDTFWVNVFRLNMPETTSFLLVGRRFSFQLPSGKYGLEAFSERNERRDGQWSPGSLRPLRLAEPRYLFTDTLIVRARFEISGLTLRPSVLSSNDKSLTSSPRSRP